MHEKFSNDVDKENDTIKVLKDGNQRSWKNGKMEDFLRLGGEVWRVFEIESNFSLLWRYKRETLNYSENSVNPSKPLLIKDWWLN